MTATIQHVTPTEHAPVTVTFQSGATRDLHPGIVERVIGLSAEGRVVVQDEGTPWTFGLTLCCNAYDKGMEGGTGCRACYSYDDAGEYDAVVTDPIATDATDATVIPLDFKLVQRAGHERTVAYVADVVALPGGRTRQIRLSVTHWPSSRAYSATLTRQVAEPPRPGSPFSATKCSPMTDTERIGTQPTARYSAKALTAYAEQMLALADKRLGEDLGWLLGAGEVED